MTWLFGPSNLPPMPQFVTNLTNTIFALWRQFHWLPEWAVVSIITVVFVFIGWAANQVVFALLKLAVRNRDDFWKGMLKRARLKVRIAVMIAAMALAVTVSPLDPGPSEFLRQALVLLFILTIGWMLVGASDMWAVVYLRRFNMASEAGSNRASIRGSSFAACSGLVLQTIEHKCGSPSGNNANGPVGKNTCRAVC